MRPHLVRTFAALVALALLFTWAGAEAAAQTTLDVFPKQVTLDSPEASQQLLVGTVSGSVKQDVTALASYRTADVRVAEVIEGGRILPRGEGETKVRVEWKLDGQTLAAEVGVTVTGLAHPPPVSFRNSVVPILTKAGCNSGGCHGKAEGQNGFKLSIFGFDSESDYNALVKESRGRRITPAAPELSLLLRKATAELPHGGGMKVTPNSLWHRRLLRWVREGASAQSENAHPVKHIEVHPQRVVLLGKSLQQLQVMAIDASGTRRCVTVEAEYQSNAEPIADVDRRGRVRSTGVPGEAAILVRYMGHVGVCRVTLPQIDGRFVRPAEHNFVDKLVWDKLQQLRIQPSELAGDATFLRRAFLDTIGTLPTADEARRFLDDSAPDKRRRLVERLLARDEYADYWAMRWADILRVDRERVSPQGAVAMTRWLRKQFRENTPYDEFVREVVTARGSTLAESAAPFYVVHSKPESAARAVSQLFLGVRIECAQCHHHPFERWSQADYYAFAGFFTGLGLKNVATGGQKLVAQAGSDLNHPRTGEAVPAAPLGAAPVGLDAAHPDRRLKLADWMTAADNPFIARMIVNRLWAHYFGRGLVEPIDDLRATNPASNEPLLDALAEHLVEIKFDLRRFTRTLLTSRAYQLQARTNPSNQLDDQNYSHFAWKPLPAEVLLDAICQSTGIPEQFNGWPLGYRAIQVWDNRMPSYFFRVFGRPQRVSVCECERGNEPSIAQALHLMNSEESVHKIRHKAGRAARLAASDKTPRQIIDELYLNTLSRFPTSDERALMLQAFSEAGSSRRQASEDVLWVLLNTREFVYNH